MRNGDIEGWTGAGPSTESGQLSKVSPNSGSGKELSLKKNCQGDRENEDTSSSPGQAAGGFILKKGNIQISQGGQCCCSRPPLPLREELRKEFFCLAEYLNAFWMSNQFGI